MKDGLRCYDRSRRWLRVEGAAGVEVPVPLWEVRAGDVEPNSRPRLEPYPDRSERDAQSVDLSRHEQRRFRLRVAEACSKDPLLQVGRDALAVDDAQSCAEVRVERGRGDEELDRGVAE